MKRKSKKILSLSILCSVAAMCGSVGILSACNEHVHHYEWKYEVGGTEHWKECPDDGVEEEGSRGEHIFVAGECECGATETVAEKKYGKAHGQVKLRGIGGKYEYDFSDVTVDMGDEVDPDFNTETGELNIENIEAGKIYTLTISKPDYQPYVVSVLVEEDDDVEIGGSRGMVLQRDSFDTTVNWGNYNLSKANDETGEISVTNRHFMVLTKDNYDEVAFTLNLNGFKRPGGGIKQGLPLVGDDGNTIEQGIAIAFGKDVLSVRMVGKEKLAIWKTWIATDHWGGGAIDGSTENSDLYNFGGEGGAAYLTAFDKGELRLTVLRKGHQIFIYLNDNFIGSSSFAEEYDTEKCSVGFVGHSMESSWKYWKFKVEDEIPEFTVTNNTASDANGSLTITGATGGKAEFGETVTLTLSPSDGYKISKLTVGGEDVTDRLNGSSYSFVIGKDTEVKAEFAQIIPGSVNAAIKGLSFGKTTDLAGKQVTLSSNGLGDVTTTVTEDGIISIGSIPAGVWKISVEGYLPKNITVLENTEYNTEIVLERDAFNTTVNWGKFNFDKANAETGEFGVANDCFLNPAYKG